MDFFRKLERIKNSLKSLKVTNMTKIDPRNPSIARCEILWETKFQKQIAFTTLQAYATSKISPLLNKQRSVHCSNILHTHISLKVTLESRFELLLSDPP